MFATRTPFVPRSYPVRTPLVAPRAPFVPLSYLGVSLGVPLGVPPRTSGYPQGLPLGYPLRSSRGTPPIAYGLRELPRASQQVLNLHLPTKFLNGT